MNDYEFSHSETDNRFKLYIRGSLIYDFNDLEPITEKEAYNLAEELYIEYLQNK